MTTNQPIVQSPEPKEHTCRTSPTPPCPETSPATSDLRQLPSGADVARLRVATTTRRRNGEEWVDKTNYLTVEVFGAQARACAQYLSKGSRVFVDAEPDWREWTDQQGNRREAVTFKARHVLFEGARREPNPGADGAHQPTPAPVPAAVAQPAAGAPADAHPAGDPSGSATADDLPF